MNNQKIVPFLWFQNQAEEAVNFYLSFFKNAKIISTTPYGTEGPGPENAVMVINFELEGQEFVAFNGNPEFKFTESTSFCVKCETQEEIDHYWTRILDGGQPMACGWIKDKFGLSWQITPTLLPEMLQDKNPEKAGRVMQEMMKMIKIDIQKIKDAYEGR